jgi:general secretion pathway protein I
MTGTKGQARGFTLVEVLVALAILALTFTFAYRAMSGGLGRLADDGAAEAAVLVARTQLARVGGDLALADGETAGRAAGGYSWRLRITPYGGPEGGLAGHLVVVDVGWKSGRLARQVRLETVRLGPAGDRR